MYSESDSKYHSRSFKSKPNFRNNYQSRKRRSSAYEPHVVSKNNQDDVGWHEKLEKKVKDTIPDVIYKFTLASYKEIEEGLDKLNYSKSDYNYLAALDELIQSKRIYLVNQKPDVFALRPEVQNDKLERYLIYLNELK